MIYNNYDFDKLKIAGQLARQVLDFITPFVKEGVSSLQINDLCHDFIIKNNAIPAPLNYQGFPKSVCISVNNVVVHGIPSKYEILKDGDILNIDVTVIKDGFFGDTSRMYTVGNISNENKKLIEITKKCLDESIKALKPGVPLSVVGKICERIVKQYKFGIVMDFAGHGIGKRFHEDPSVLHYYEKSLDNFILKEGMVFTVEPMINAGTHEIYIEADNWTAKTCDGKNSAQFEHTVGITKNGVVIFTN